MEDEAFVIMQIGNDDLDAVYEDALAPAITNAGLTPRRIDRHNSGDLLKSEIVQFIERSQIIVADLTGERPNCYLEIGYAMGLGKKANLILTAREDHHHSSPNFRRDGPRVHFDLEGYDILFWDGDELNSFRDKLTKRIKRRLIIVQDTNPRSPANEDWRDQLRGVSHAGLSAIGRSGYMEVSAELRPLQNWGQQRLLDAVRNASVHTFGWPIAIVLDNRDEFRPRPTTDGVVAEVSIGSANESDSGRHSYDFWKLFRDGRFYTLLSLFEDERVPNRIFFDTRIFRVTESVLFLARLYRRLGASDTDQIHVQVRHGGLWGRELDVANKMRDLILGRTASIGEVDSSITASLIDLETNLVDYVAQLVQPLFVIFDFFEVSDTVLDQLVSNFVDGKVK